MRLTPIPQKPFSNSPRSTLYYLKVETLDSENIYYLCVQIEVIKPYEVIFEINTNKTDEKLNKLTSKPVKIDKNASK